MGVEDLLDHIENTVIADIDRLAPKDRLAIYLNALEFTQHKLQRASAAPVGNSDTNFTIEHVTKDNKRISED